MIPVSAMLIHDSVIGILQPGLQQRHGLDKLE
jgi:hypothetical protein